MIEKIIELFKRIKEKIIDLYENNNKGFKMILILGPGLLCLAFSLVISLFNITNAIGTAFVFMLIIYPVEIFLINICALVLTIRYPHKFLPGTLEARFFGTVDIITVIIGVILTLAYAGLISEIDLNWNAEWSEQLYNDCVHQPVWTGALPTVGTFIVIGLIGYIILLKRKMSDTPPLITVMCIAAMYIGASQLILFIIQIFKITPFEGLAYSTNSIPFLLYCPLTVLPLCCLGMVVRLIIRKIYEWNQDEEHTEDKYKGEGIIGFFNEALHNSAAWPLAALVAMIPLLGVVLAVLALFGQYPDHAIRAWTETAQWNLSRMKAPQNIQMDEHYLCTVAAGGHEKVVKPVRMGVRHGHKIVVNRQLLIANAFEQILEEKTPRLHKEIRKFYDDHGYPIARHIKTKTAADIVYYIMKPLEMIFLLILYLTDPKPENRIAVQYMDGSAKTIV
ncbi:MAG: hypothetical protein K6E98_00565 [Lachnospiraceae bacterium]|nr:hypothetical protein [Lachnospiraceae bacterium]